MVKRYISKIIGDGTQSKIVKGVFWSFLGTFISRGLIFISLFLVARFLSVEEYGKVGLMQSFITSFSIFSLASFGITATKYLAQYIDIDINKSSEIYSLTRLFAFGTASFMLILSIVFNYQLTELVTGTQSLRVEILICSITIFFSSMNGLQVGALSGLQSFKKISIVNITNGLLSFPLILVGAYWNGVLGVVIALLIVHFSIWLCSAILLNNELKASGVRVKVKGIGKHWDVLYKFSLPAFISNIMVSPVILICNSILVKYHSNGYYEMGIYNAVFNYSQLGAILLGIIGQVFTPLAMKNFGKGNKKFDFYNITHSYFIGLFIFIPIIILPDLFMMPFGDKYANQSSYYSLIFISLSSIVTAQRQGIARNFIAGNYMWYSVLSNFIWAFCTISFSYVFLSQGAEGRAKALLLGYLVNTVVFIPFYVKRVIVSKELISNVNHYLILIIIGVSGLTYHLFYTAHFGIRIFLVISSCSVIISLFYVWYKRYVHRS